MLKSRIIPCLDVSNGRVVKGTNFLNLQDAGDPVQVAKLYDLQGADELCFNFQALGPFPSSSPSSSPSNRHFQALTIPWVVELGSH